MVARSRSKLQLHTVNEETLMRMEGLLQLLTEQPFDQRPKALTHDYLANQLAVPVHLVQEWYLSMQRSYKRWEIAQRFVDLYNLIANKLSERLTGTAFTIACDANNRRALDAIKWILPRTDPAGWGEQRKLKDENDSTNALASIPQGVFDIMTNEEIAELEELQARIDDAFHKCEQVLRVVNLRYAASQVEPVDENVH
jgi:hypothetical protein